ncbi:glycoside hydrolase family 2 protein [Anaeromicropila herbilytica]|uniref:Beta-D-galactosidase n=1 Tax=Anaeromicropila herbilytica TaxID=2785025 RepID=A0A7R7ICM6_9FIRM|nr:glycoside hydrolase family 2 TIM barrel-domain containing protein [Anaeromicropila herbilytica]BCN30094.1 beta-D-galactosidase [Anaeromicropila herbilytica]
MRLYWNEDWGYTPIFTEKLFDPSYGKGIIEVVRLPHSNVTMPYHYFDETCYQIISGYRKVFFAEEAWKKKKIFITFEGVAHVATIYLNGTQIAEHKGGYTAFTVDLSDHIRFGEVNVLVVQVDSRESLNIPPFGNVIDYMTYGGIYRQVYLEVKENVYIEDVFVKTKDNLQERKRLNTQVTISSQKEVSVKQVLMDVTKLEELSMEELLSIEVTDPRLHVMGKASLDSVASSAIDIQMQDLCVKLWSPEQPKLYVLRTEVYVGETKVDSKVTRIAFREARFAKDGFYLNGSKYKIRGLNRHQSYPYVGYAMPSSAQINDVHILKHELHVNAVRTSHYPQDQAFLDACDEQGLLVFTELPGWQHIGDEAWKEVAVDSLKEMILQNRNHPSIILWGVRINESQDDDAFYEKTNALAHELDPTRQTGGVRFLQKSNLLEDVYTYNDFLHNGTNPGVEEKKKVTPDENKGYLISEYNGHMFPTKAFDGEEHRLEHALRHARVVDAYYGQHDIAGGFAWCMFDYNTHQDFGSGDRICYHGVLDMFRNPKLAAAVYSSQSDEDVVLEISSSMDIGEHPACNIGTVYAFTNADSVRVYKNDEYVREFYPDREMYHNMPHPPILIDDFVGELMEKGEGFSKSSSDQIKEVLFAVTKYGQNSLPFSYKLKMLKVMLKNKLKVEDGINLYYKYIGNWGGKVTRYRFEAMKDGKVVKTVIKEPVTKLELAAKVDKTILTPGATYDVSTVRLQMKDQNGNQLPYYQEPLMLKVSGPLEIIGPKIISLKGGMGGTFIKTTGEPGEGTLSIYGEKIEKVEIAYQIK